MNNSNATDKLRRQLQFLLEADKLKSIERVTILTDKSRRESTAEHSWHIALIAMVLYEYAEVDNIDLNHAIHMLLVHDLVEVYAGDTPAFGLTGHETKEAREQEAADKLFAILPEEQATEYRSLWEEFEAAETPEARYAVAVDQLQPLLINHMTDGHTWVKQSVSVEQVYKRMEPVKAALPTLWPFVEDVIQGSLKKGFLR